MKHDRRNNKTRWRRKNRVRRHLRGSADRPRLTIRRSNQHISCQIIDDERGVTLASASTRDQSLRDQVSYGGNRDAAKAIGLAIAERGKAAGVNLVKFDRGPYRYHGRVAALADGAREGGLEF